MAEAEILQGISTVGFPIVAYLLVMFRTEKVISSLTEAVNNNTNAISILMQKEAGHNGE